MSDDKRLNDHGEDQPGFLRRMRPMAIIAFVLFVLSMIVNFVFEAVGTVTFR
jgi:hypothetical protein